VGEDAGLEGTAAEQEVDMKVGVSGASGHLGKAVVSELLQRRDGREVVAITRTPETVSVPARGRFGDYNRPESLAEAYAGLDRLLIIPTLEPGKRAAQNVAAIDAAVRAGVKHVVFMSTAGARQEEEPALSASYWRGEQHLIAKAPAWTILRMNYYAEGLVQQAQASLSQGVLTGLGENRVAFVARGDVAAAAAGILIGDGHAGAIYNATGPERLSGAQRAALIAEITGRPLAFHVITEEQLRAGLTKAGLPGEVVNVVVSIQASFAAGAFDIVTGDVEHLGGRPPRPLRDVLAGALKSPSA
jgi:NAD(P)H dehydrogenase (quinone)